MTNPPDALDIARVFARAGIPVFCAPPDSMAPTGFKLPLKWQTTKAEERYIDAWRPGRALCAVMGQGLDLIDVDPRNGGNIESLNGLMPKVYGVASTPSGGEHYLVKSLGLHSRDNIFPGIDYKGGSPDGQGRGFAFIDPTVRVSKTTGELVAYQWIEEPNLDGIEDDNSGAKLAEHIRSLRERPGSGVRIDYEDILAGVPEGQRDRKLFEFACSLRAKNIPRRWAEEMVLAAAANCTPPFDRDLALLKVESAWKYEPSAGGFGTWGARQQERQREEQDQGGEERPGLNFVTARELSERTPVEPESIVEGLLARRVITELSAKIKVGKTTFWAMMVAAIMEGRPFIDRLTAAGPVVLLTEERESTIRAMLRRAGLEDEDELYILQRHQARTLEWPDVVAEAVAFALSVGATTLIIDTLPDWAGIRGDAENNTGDALAAMEPLQDAAAHGLAVLVVRHDRKAGGDIGDSARGASAFGGAVDIILGLRRADSPGHENRRTLLGVGRFDGIPEELTIELSDGEYVCLGTGADVERRQARDAILDILPEDGIGALSEAEIVEATGKVRSTIRRALEDCLKAEEIVRKSTGAGKSGRAAGYALRVVSTLGCDPGHTSSGYASESGVTDECSGERTPEQTDMFTPQPLGGHNVRPPGGDFSDRCGDLCRGEGCSRCAAGAAVAARKAGAS